MPIIVTIGAIIIGFIFASSGLASILGLLAAVISLHLTFSGRIKKLEADLVRIRQVLARGWKEDQAVERKKETEAPLEKPTTEPPTVKAAAHASGKYEESVEEKSAEKERMKEPSFKRVSPLPQQTERKAPATSPSKVEEFFEGIVAVVKSYFTDGNLFVRIGILVLFFGVAFLLKYAVDHTQLPVELRFIATAIGGLVLLTFGWRLRLKKDTYALLLQGAGVGIIYITIFAAFQIQNLISTAPTFALLAVFSLLSALLAVAQNSRSLAVFGILGGFLAPLLVSSGSNNYIALFSYYGLLNAAVLFMAWYKTWRRMNLLGLAFTFGVFALWTVRNYSPEMMMSADPFLILFFFMYSAIGIMYAFRQPLALKGYVDGTLVFGTPLIAFSIQAALVRHTEYGIAISAAGFGLYYILLARMLWTRHGEGMRLLAEAMLALGVIFLTLAIPYALDGHWSTATWALEAAGILWVAIKQQRKFTQYFALALQLGAGLMFLARNADDIGLTPFLNPAFMGGVFVALGGLITAWQLYQLNRREPESLIGPAHMLFFVWGILWWLGAAYMQIDHYVDAKLASVILLLTVTSFVFMFLSVKRKWDWQPADITALLLVPALGLIGLLSLMIKHHAFIMPDVLYWIPALVLCRYIMQQLGSTSIPSKIFEWVYLIWVSTVTLLLSVEMSWRFANAGLNVGNAWSGIVIAILPLLVMHAVQKSQWGALSRFGTPLKHKILTAMAVGAGLWSLNVAISNSADTTPLPYLPLLNPIDLLHILYFLFAVGFIRSFKQSTEIKNGLNVVVGILAFIWLNSALLRSLHHYLEIPYDISAMLSNITVQIALSILWTILGMVAMLMAARRRWRPTWIIGAVLVTIVLVKMVTVDLVANGTIERIISFLVVGSLLVVMGYFSPIPGKEKEIKQGEND